MDRSDWKLFAWVWMAGMTCLGAGLLLAQLVFPSESDWARDGLGTALLLVAASIFFIVVFETLPRISKDTIAIIASIITAIFVYAGTIFTLESENTLLMVIVLILTVYSIAIGAIVVFMGKLVRAIFNRRR